MRFTSNAFIVSTVALLSLITPVAADSGDVAQITTPSAGQTLHAFDSIEVLWTILNSAGLDGVDCNIALLNDDPAPVPASPGILQSSVPLLGGQSVGPITIPDVVSSDPFFLALISEDQTTIFGRSGDFTIV